MKIILYLAISANGFIAKINDDTPWSKEEWENYKTKVKEVGNLVIGRKTYELMDDFSNLGNPTVVILSSRKIKTKEKIFSANSFSQALDILKKQGFKKVLVAGGAQMNKTALESGLIDEIYLDVEPFIFGSGIPLFASSIINKNLKLIGIKKYGNNSIQLHYVVLK